MVQLTKPVKSKCTNSYMDEEYYVTHQNICGSNDAQLQVFWCSLLEFCICTAQVTVLSEHFLDLRFDFREQIHKLYICRQQKCPCHGWAQMVLKAYTHMCMIKYFLISKWLWNTTACERAPIIQLLTKFCAFYESQRCITVITTARQWTLSQPMLWKYQFLHILCPTNNCIKLMYKHKDFKSGGNSEIRSSINCCFKNTIMPHIRLSK